MQELVKDETCVPMTKDVEPITCRYTRLSANMIVDGMEVEHRILYVKSL